MLFLSLGTAIAFAAIGGMLHGALASGSASLQVSSLTFGAAADAYLAANHPHNNYGTQSTVRVDGKPVNDTLLRFTVAGIGGGTVTSAKLRLYVDDASDAGGDVHRLLNNTWNESTVTWKTAPAGDPPPVGSIGSVVKNTWAEVDVRPLVTGDGTVGLRITTTTEDFAAYLTREKGAATAPQLVVTFTSGMPPQNTTSPTITGPAQEAAIVTASPGTWSGTTPIGYGYQWRRCDGAGAACASIAGETGSTYRLTSADVNRTVRVLVTATNTVGAASASSAPHGPIAASASQSPPQNTAPPVITGPTVEGQVVSASQGTWTGGAANSYTYRWRSCDASGAACVSTGATDSTYLLTAADVDRTVRVMVTAANSAGTAVAVSSEHGPIQAAPPSTSSVVFAAVGDVGGNSNSAKTLDAVKTSGAEFLLLLGDVGYSEVTPESAWCSWAFSRLGAGYPLQLISGNHEEDTGPDGRIGEFAKCAPDRMSSIGTYAAEYYFDQGPLRVILIAADLQVGGVRYAYAAGDAHYNWLRDRIREAKTAGKWVVLGMHEVCLSAGNKTCSIGDALQDLLIAEKVDLVLQGHDHDYQRFHSLKCANPGAYDAACVADNGSDRAYARNAGTVFAINGTGGRGLTTINTADVEYPYVAAWMGGQTANRGNGFLKLTASSSELRAVFVNATNPSGYTDSFAITG